MEYVRDALGMTNSRVGYVFLVDENLKIRWGGCADATDEEVRSLESCTGVLLKRLEREKLKGDIRQHPQSHYLEYLHNRSLIVDKLTT